MNADRIEALIARAGSVGSICDSYDNALAETINLYKAEVIHRRGPWRNFEAVEFATLEWRTGLTTAASSSPWATCRRPKPKNATTLSWSSQTWQHDSNQTASEEPGAVHPAISCGHRLHYPCRGR
jgi:hypothetical protein